MAWRWGLGPVFAFEACLIVRRWQVYAGRAVLVVGLLAAMAVIWLSRGSAEFASIADLAQVGRSFFSAMINTEMVLVLLVAPAAAAGAICYDKARGGLAIVMVTDLSNAEIVLGKLAARLVTLIGIIVCALPVLALATLLGGVDPWAIAAGALVVVGGRGLGRERGIGVLALGEQAARGADGHLRHVVGLAALRLGLGHDLLGAGLWPEPDVGPGIQPILAPLQ
jgi:hypothetical protein